MNTPYQEKPRDWPNDASATSVKIRKVLIPASKALEDKNGAS